MSRVTGIVDTLDENEIFVFGSSRRIQKVLKWYDTRTNLFQLKIGK